MSNRESQPSVRTKVYDGPAKSKHRQIGQILLHRGQIRGYQLEFALHLQKNYQKLNIQNPIGQILLEHRVLTQSTLRDALSLQKEIPYESVTQIVNALGLEEDGDETKIIPDLI